MNRRQGLRAALAIPAAACHGLAGAQAPAARVGELKSLGQDRYQIGRIVIDKRAGRFTVPGRVYALGKPLEYLATSPGGMKGYETLFELDAGGSEFNLACILVGLERDPKQPRFIDIRQGPRLPGRRVSIDIAWSEGATRRKVSAAEALLNPEAGVKPESVEWVYIGSPASGDSGRFAADDTGTLIGFIHDSNCIIESAVTIGVGAYGSVRGSTFLPASGAAIEMIIDASSGTK